MSKKLIFGVVGALAVIAAAVFGGIKFQKHLLQQELADNVKQVQEQLNAQWAQIKIIDNNIMITGETVDNETHKELISQLTKVKGINTVTSKVKVSRPLSMEQCQENIDSLLANNDVEFSSQNSKIDSASHDVLQEIAKNLWLCPDANLLIVSHTSNEDDIDDNIQTSELRSAALLEYFNNSLGFSDRQIAAVGMGAAFPIAMNDSDENRDLNDRIEIKIRSINL